MTWREDRTHYLVVYNLARSFLTLSLGWCFLTYGHIQRKIQWKYALKISWRVKTKLETNTHSWINGYYSVVALKKKNWTLLAHPQSLLPFNSYQNKHCHLNAVMCCFFLSFLLETEYIRILDFAISERSSSKSWKYTEQLYKQKNIGIRKLRVTLNIIGPVPRSEAKYSGSIPTTIEMCKLRGIGKVRNSNWAGEGTQNSKKWNV